MIYAIFGAMSLLAAIITIFSFAVVADRVRATGETNLLRLISILVIVGGTALPALIRILSGFEVDDPRGASYDGSNILAVVWLKRFFTGSILILATAGLLRRLPTLVDIRSPGASLMLAYVAFALLSLVIGAIFSAKPALLPALYYSIVVLLLLFVAKDADLGKVLETVIYCLKVLLVGSLLLAIFSPNWVFTKSTASMLPGISERLVGLTSHPNVLGPLALLYLLLDSSLSKPKPIDWAMRATAVLVIIFAQSKTVWLASLFILTSFVAFKLFSQRRFFTKSASGWLVILAIASSAVIFALLLAALTFGIDHLESLPGFRNIATFVGRSEIWKITLDLWEKHPLFGYGPTLWSPEFRQSYAMLYVGQAHNQFIQTLGDSGLIGITGLIIYVATLVSYCLRLSTVSQGISISVLILILVRSLTETPMRALGVADPTFLMHFIVLLSVLYWSRVAAHQANVKRGLAP